MAKSVYSSRSEVVWRCIIGLVGGYAIAAGTAVLVTRISGLEGRDASSLGEMLGFLAFGLAVILAFSFSRLRKSAVVIGGSLIVIGVCLAIAPVSAGGAA